MIRSPIGLRLNPDSDTSLKDRLREAARLGAKGVILDAAGDMAPSRLGETARRELRHLLRTTELSLIALHLPTRRSFDRDDDLDDRLTRAEGAFELAYELGSKLTLVNIGALPAAADEARVASLRNAVTQLTHRADRRGVTLGIEAGAEPASEMRAFVDSLPEPRPTISLNPAAFAVRGQSPSESVVAFAGLLAHAYATDSPPSGLIVGRPAAFDWAEYLGALEEVDYRGFLTVWPQPNDDASARFREYLSIFRRF